MSEKLIRMVELLIKFRDQGHSAVQTRIELKEYNLHAFLQGLLDGRLARQSSKPVLVEGTKEHFHDYCFDEYVRHEKAMGIYNIDKGSRPFGANYTSRCHACGEVINVGVRVVVRRIEPSKATG